MRVITNVAMRNLVIAGVSAAMAVLVGYVSRSPTMSFILLGAMAAVGALLWLGYAERLSPSDLLVICVLAYAPVARLGPIVYVGPRLLLIIIPFIFVFHALRHRPLVLPHSSWINWSNLLLFTGGMVSLTVSLDLNETSWAVVHGFVLPMLFFYALGCADLNQTKVRVHLWIVLLSSSLTMGVGLIAFYNSFGIPSDVNQLIHAHFDIVRMAPFQNATFGNVLHTGDLLLLLVPPSVAFWWETRGSRRFLITLVLAIQAVTFAVIASRSTTVVLLLALTLLIWITGRSWKSFALVLSLWCILVAAVIGNDTTLDPILERYRIIYEGDASTGDRLVAMRMGWDIFIRNVWTGVGLGTYRLHEPTFTAAHNTVINFAAETGLLGLAGSLGLFLYPFTRLRHFLVARQVPLVITGCWVGLLAFSIQSLISGTNFAVANSNVWGVLFWYFARVCAESATVLRPAARNQDASVAG